MILFETHHYVIVIRDVCDYRSAYRIVYLFEIISDFLGIRIIELSDYPTTSVGR